MHSNKILSFSLTAIFGAIYFSLLAIAWAYIPNFNPITQWLLENLAGTNWYRPLVFIHDFIVNTLLAFPLAALIFFLRPKHYILYLVVALLPSFAWTHSVWFHNENFNALWLPIVLGWANELFCVPIALMIICWFKRTRT